MTGFAEIRMQKLQSLTHKPLCLWFLNHRFDEAEAVRQVRFMKEQGFGGHFMHWINGGEPYMGTRWLEAIGSIVEISAREGMEAWLYDEAWCPSGFAGGRLLASRPGLRAQAIHHETRDIEGGAECCLRFELMEPLAILAAPLGETGPLLDEAVHLDAELGTVTTGQDKPYRHDWGYYPHGGEPQLHWRQSHTVRAWDLTWRPPAGSWRLYAFFAKQVADGNNTWVNVLDRAVVDAFLAETHDVYAERFGSYFGTVIPGIMTDESKHVCLPWSGELAERFEDAAGRTLVSCLPHLIDASLPGHQTVRLVYHSLVSELFHTNFIRPMAEWCRAHDLLLTGHISPEEDPSHEVRYTGSIARHLEWFDIPGEDLIIQAVGTEERRGLNLGPRLASSAARQHGKRRVFSEVGACCEENVSLAELKLMADWLMVHGVTEIAWHGFNYSQAGFRKFYAGSNQYLDSNLTGQMHLLNAYVESTSRTLCEYGPSREVAVLKPHSSLRALAMPGEELDACEAVDEQLVDAVWALLTAQCEFDLLDEDTMDEWQIADGVLHHGSASYRAVIVPQCPFVHETAADRLGRMLGQGGVVVCVGGKPGTISASSIAEWAAPVVIESSPREAVARAMAVCPPPVMVSSAGAADVLCYYGRNDLGDAVSFCLNLSGESVAVSLEHRGARREVVLHARGSELVVWGEEQPVPVTVARGRRIEFPGPWDVRSHRPNHVPLTDRSVVLQIEEGADVGRLIVEQDERENLLEALRIDGQSVEGRATAASPFYDPCNRCVEVGDLLGPGEHVIEVPGDLLLTAMLAGQFTAVRSAGGTWLLSAVSDRATSLERIACGYPYLRGRLSFSTTFCCPDDTGRDLLLHLPGRAGYVEAHVDGAGCGACAWEPNTIRVPPLSAGEHRLVLDVMGDSIGLLRGAPTPAGLGGPPFLA